MRVLILSRNYPNQVLPTLGLWVESIVTQCATREEIRVIAPVPYCPPLPGAFATYSRFRQVPRTESRSGITVYHPRILMGPGYSLHAIEAWSYYHGIRRMVKRLLSSFHFDLIHAHFGYPDGVVASRLGQEFSVPVIVTDHAFWTPWMDDYPGVRKATIKASSHWTSHVSVSRRHKENMLGFTRLEHASHVIPLGMDTSIFRPRAAHENYDSNRILFVGFINYTKGIDLLLHAMRELVDNNPNIRLTLVGGGLYGHKIRQESILRKLSHDLGLDDFVEFVGVKSPEEVANYMRKSALVVSASRRETFGAVLVEALGCGIPVVATRCGGPEDIVTDQVGVLVEPENYHALASGIQTVLTNLGSYETNALSNYAATNYSWQLVTERYMKLYVDALSSSPSAV